MSLQTLLKYMPIFYSLTSPPFKGKKAAPTAEIITVKIIVFIPSEICMSCSQREDTKLNKKLQKTSENITLSLFAAGIIIAINIPYNATEKAETSLTGNTSPAIAPKNVPNAHAGDAVRITPKV